MAEQEFPSLGAAATVKETKKDKKKKQTMSLADFVGGGTGASRRGIPDDSLLSLPTAPRPRAEGEEPSEPQLGGGFRGYGKSGSCHEGSGYERRPATPSPLLILSC